MGKIVTILLTYYGFIFLTTHPSLLLQEFGPLSIMFARTTLAFDIFA